MFEQSLLAPGASARKPASFALSFLVQAACVTVALAIPMFQVARIQWKPEIIVYAPPRVKPPEVVVSKSTAPAKASALRTIFHSVLEAPRKIPQAIAQIDDLGFMPPMPTTGLAGAAAGLLLPEPMAPESGRAAKAGDGPASVPAPKPVIARVSKGVQMAKLLREVKPVYPSLARAARIEGVVRIRAVIAKDGTIRNLRLLSGHPLLAQSALDAVRQWLYAPTLLSGEVVEVETEIDVNFMLGR